MRSRQLSLYQKKIFKVNYRNCKSKAAVQTNLITGAICANCRIKILKNIF